MPSSSLFLVSLSCTDKSPCANADNRFFTLTIGLLITLAIISATIMAAISAIISLITSFLTNLSISELYADSGDAITTRQFAVLSSFE